MVPNRHGHVVQQACPGYVIGMVFYGFLLRHVCNDILACKPINIMIIGPMTAKIVMTNYE